MGFQHVLDEIHLYDFENIIVLAFVIYEMLNILFYFFSHNLNPTCLYPTRFCMYTNPTFLYPGLVIGVQGMVWEQRRERFRDGGNGLRAGEGMGWGAWEGTSWGMGDGDGGNRLGDGDWGRGSGLGREETNLRLRYDWSIFDIPWCLYQTTKQIDPDDVDWNHCHQCSIDDFVMMNPFVIKREVLS